MLKPGEYIRDLLTSEPGRVVTARGWIKTRRDSKGVHFLQLSDGSSFRDLQVVVPSGSGNNYFKVANVGAVTAEYALLVAGVSSL